MTPLVLNTGIEEVRKHSTWFLVLGIALVIIGMIAIGSAVAMTIVSVMFLGWLLIIAGLFEVIHGFKHRPWSGFFINLLGGVLYAVAGIVMVANPALAAVTLTLVIAIILIVAGVFRLFIAVSTPLHHRGWLILNGAISILLGVMIWSSWPVSGLWVIGLFIGIDMIFDGWTEIMLALSARSLPV
ncbi:MAG TPA: HdeD family acid-resistance protein [Candidatus Binataceae bacterium]|nr:HdeD family acid-resistance protein [Candidatus Binataceae bacterium]